MKRNAPPPSQVLDPSLNVRTMQTRMFQQVAEKVGATVAFDGGGTGRRSGRADVGFLKKSDTSSLPNTPRGEDSAPNTPRDVEIE